MKISECETIVDLEVFKAVYEARKDAVPILADGVKKRMKLYLNNISAIKEITLKP